MKKMLAGLLISMTFVGGMSVSEVRGATESGTNEDFSKNAENFVQELGNAAIAIINRPKITTQEVRKEFSDLLKKNFGMSSIARYSLGKNYRLLSPEEKEDFQKSFENMLARVYSSKFNEYKGTKLKVTGFRRKSTKQLLVNSVLIVPKKENIDVVWSIYQTKDGLKVYDAIISDVSISNVQRSEFMGKISKEGLKKFLKDFKEKYK